jgi:hypothetical protein
MSDTDSTTVTLPGCGCLTLILTVIAGLLALILLKLCGVSLGSVALWAVGVVGGLIALVALVAGVIWATDKYSY